MVLVVVDWELADAFAPAPPAAKVPKPPEPPVEKEWAIDSPSALAALTEASELAPGAAIPRNALRAPPAPPVARLVSVSESTFLERVRELCAIPPRPTAPALAA